MSTLSRVVFDPDTTPPSVPLGLAATAVGADRIDLSWSPSSDTGGSGLAGYDLQRNASTVIPLGVQTSYSDTGLVAATAYSYRVRARDGNGNSSAYGNSVNATTQGSSGTVAGLRDYYGLDPHRFVAGDATGTGNGLSQSSPWTWTQMLANATSGMIVGVLPGLVTRTSAAQRHIPTFNPPSGVTIVCRRSAAYNTTDRTEFRNAGGASGATFGGNGRSGIRWIGAYVNEVASPSADDTGPVVDWACSSSEYHGLLIQCATISRDSNHNALRVEQSANTLLKNSILRGCKYSEGAGQNHGAWMSYDSVNPVIDQCEFSDNDFDLFAKGEHVGVGYINAGLTTRYSTFTGARAGWMHLGGSNGALGQSACRHHNNLIRSTPTGVYFHSFGTAITDGHPSNNLFDNNTFVNVAIPWYWGWGSGALPYAHDIQILRNLMMTATRIHDFVELGNTDLARVIANGCLSNENHAQGYSQFGNIAGTSLDLAAWRTRTQQQGGQWEGSTTTGDPLFVNAASGNYRLQSGSPAAGKGCYVTGNEVIGLEV